MNTGSGHGALMQNRRWLRRLADPRFDWQLLQTFLDVAGTGSFRQTAIERLAALNTIRGRIAELERITGRPLLLRAQRGVTLTPDGETVLAVARAMDGARGVVVAAMAGENDAALSATSPAATENQDTPVLLLHPRKDHGRDLGRSQADRARPIE